MTDVTNTKLLTCQGDDPLVDNSANALTVVNNGAKASTFGPFDAADAGEGGLAWMKIRDSSGYYHALMDTERGASQQLATNVTRENYNLPNGLKSFNSNGFSIGSDVTVNKSGNGFASWTFRKAPKFFDVVTVTAPSSGTLQVSHDLGTTVGCIILKSTSDADNWIVYHRSEGANSYGKLNATDAWASSTGIFDGVTDTYFTITVGNTVTANRDYVAYLFAHNDGDGDFGPDGDADIIKCGSYTGPYPNTLSVDLGFEPQWVLIKSATEARDWQLMDTMRGMPVSNSSAGFARLEPNTTDAEANVTGGTGTIEPTPTGFNVAPVDGYSEGGWNKAGQTFIYIAIRRGPMAVPEDATDVFDVAFDGALDTNKPYVRSDLNYVDMTINNSRTGTTYHRVGSRLTQGKYLDTNSSSAESTFSFYQYDFQNGWFDLAASNSINTNGISWMWKRAPSFCDVVAYTGTGANRTVSHNLGVAPEMIWVKNRGATASWAVYHKDVGNNKALVLDQTGASFNANWWNSTTPTDSLFYIGGDEATVNTSSNNYIAYLFASLDGVSKVGSFTVSAGQSSVVDCGFSSGARFVLIKRTDGSDYWWVFDTERGITVSSSPGLRLDTTLAESSDTYLTPNSSGFATVAGYFAAGDYLFYAIA